MLQIIFRDEGGYISIKSPSEVISFLNDRIYFDDGEVDYQIPVKTLVCIVNDKES